MDQPAAPLLLCFKTRGISRASYHQQLQRKATQLRTAAAAHAAEQQQQQQQQQEEEEEAEQQQHPIPIGTVVNTS